MVEFAVVLPLLCAILFGIIEYGYLFLVQQTLTNAAREGCRIAVLQSSTEPYAAVTARIQEIVNAAGIEDGEYNITMTHATIPNPTEQITISVDYHTVALTGVLPSDFIGYGGGGGGPGTLRGRCSMRKEGM